MNSSGNSGSSSPRTASAESIGELCFRGSPRLPSQPAPPVTSPNSLRVGRLGEVHFPTSRAASAGPLARKEDGKGQSAFSEKL